MSYTKGELASAALEEIGIAEYEYDISPEQKQSAIQRLDSMMAEWGARGIKLSFPISKSINSAPGDDSNIPDWAWEAVITNLALKIAPSYGKVVSAESKASAKHSLNTLYSMFAKPTEMQLPSMPKGAGYKTTEFRFTPAPGDPYVEQVNEDVDLSGGPVDES